MNKIAAIVIGAELNGLGVVRSLAQQEIPSIVVDTLLSKAALWSRHAQRHIIRSFSGSDFVEDIIHLGKSFTQRPMLFLTNEAAVHTVSENRNELSRWFRFRLPQERIVKILSNKSSFHHFATDNGFFVPRSIVMRNVDDLAKLANLRFPCALKLDDKRLTGNNKSMRTVRVNSREEATKYAEPFLQMMQGIVAQEWIDGPESNLYFTLFYRGSEGNYFRSFTGQKILCSPRDVGNTAICRAAPEVHEELEHTTLAFARNTDFEGMGSMEYKWDNIYKKYFMVEPTVGRTDWQEEIATICGMNIPAAAYRYEFGLPPLTSDRPIHSSAMWRSTFSHRVPSNLHKKHTHIVDGYFRWNDPFPALQYYCLNDPLSRIAQRWQRHLRDKCKISFFDGKNNATY